MTLKKLPTSSRINIAQRLVTQHLLTISSTIRNIKENIIKAIDELDPYAATGHEEMPANDS